MASKALDPSAYPQTQTFADPVLEYSASQHSGLTRVGMPEGAPACSYDFSAHPGETDVGKSGFGGAEPAPQLQVTPAASSKLMVARLRITFRRVTAP